MPILVLPGDADPITPPLFDRQAAPTLGTSPWLTVFAHASHSVAVLSACCPALVSALMHTASTATDTACGAAVPAVRFE